MSNMVNLGGGDGIFSGITLDDAVESEKYVKDNAGEVAYHIRRLKCGGWKFIQPDMNWEEYCQFTFGKSRHAVAQLGKMEEVNATEGVHVSKQVHAEVLVKVPEERRKEVLEEAWKQAPINIKTGRPQLTSAVLSKVAEEVAQVDMGIIPRSRPSFASGHRSGFQQPTTPEMSDTDILRAIHTVLQDAEKAAGTLDWRAICLNILTMIDLRIGERKREDVSNFRHTSEGLGDRDSESDGSIFDA